MGNFLSDDKKSNSSIHKFNISELFKIDDIQRQDFLDTLGYNINLSATSSEIPQFDQLSATSGVNNNVANANLPTSGNVSTLSPSTSEIVKSVINKNKKPEVDTTEFAVDVANKINGNMSGETHNISGEIQMHILKMLSTKLKQ